jgi:hypothetical protein
MKITRDEKKTFLITWFREICEMQQFFISVFVCMSVFANITLCTCLLLSFFFISKNPSAPNVSSFIKEKEYRNCCCINFTHIKKKSRISIICYWMLCNKMWLYNKQIYIASPNHSFRVEKGGVFLDLDVLCDKIRFPPVHTHAHILRDILYI